MLLVKRIFLDSPKLLLKLNWEILMIILHGLQWCQLPKEKKINQISIDEIDWLTKLRRGLEETRKGFVTELLDKLGDDPLTPESLDDLETLLLRADVGIDSTDKVINSLRTKLNEEVVGGEAGIKFLKKELKSIIDKPIKNSGTDLLVPQKGKLNVWLLVGVNGVGKTTTLGKLAYLSSKSNYKTLIAAADTCRAAAVEQLKVWGDRSNVDVISNQSKNADPAAVVFDAINSAKKEMLIYYLSIQLVDCKQKII